MCPLPEKCEPSLAIFQHDKKSSMYLLQCIEDPEHMTWQVIFRFWQITKQIKCYHITDPHTKYKPTA